VADNTFDLIVIGAGPGGYVAAIRAAQLGFQVAVIEKEKPGGVCLNVGCIPSKALIHQAEIFTHGKELGELGATVDWEKFDYRKVHAKTQHAADTLSKGVQFLMRKNKITYFEGAARLASHTEVEITARDGAREVVKGKYILIASGSRPRELPGFEFDESLVLSSTGALALTALPRSLIILGAGVIGMEFANIMAAFDVKVTVIELLPQILAGADEELALLMRKDCEKKGIEILTSHKAQALKKSKSAIELTVENAETSQTQTFKADKILVAVGRAPNSEGLNLDEMGIQRERDFIRVSNHYRTTVSNIYAIGDVIATPQLAHVASKEGEIAVEHMAGLEPQHTIFPADLYPFAVYTDPEVAWFGPTEQELAESGAAYSVSRFPYRGAGKSVAVSASEGVVKLCFDKETSELFSAHIFGKNATELIHELLLAKQAELLPEDIADVVHAHPTLSEVMPEVSRAVRGLAIHV